MIVKIFNAIGELVHLQKYAHQGEKIKFAGDNANEKAIGELIDLEGALMALFNKGYPDVTLSKIKKVQRKIKKLEVKL